MDDIHLELGTGDKFWEHSKKINIINLDEDPNDFFHIKNFSTLKDLLAVGNFCCPQGVLWNLASELSKQLNVDYLETLKALFIISEKYHHMTWEDSKNRFHENEHPSNKFFMWRDEYWKQSKKGE
jgi:hypothetical protein